MSWPALCLDEQRKAEIQALGKGQLAQRATLALKILAGGWSWSIGCTLEEPHQGYRVVAAGEKGIGVYGRSQFGQMRREIAFVPLARLYSVRVRLDAQVVGGALIVLQGCSTSLRLTHNQRGWSARCRPLVCSDSSSGLSWGDDVGFVAGKPGRALGKLAVYLHELQRQNMLKRPKDAVS